MNAVASARHGRGNTYVADSQASRMLAFDVHVLGL
jgi:hypothetical protein